MNKRRKEKICKLNIDICIFMDIYYSVHYTFLLSFLNNLIICVKFKKIQQRKIL